MYSAVVQEHFHQPRRVGPLADATHFGTAGVPGDGPYIQLWLRVDEGLVRSAAYRTYGCPAAVGSASMAAQLVEGLSLEDALQVSAAQIVSGLGGLPEGKEHCPQLAAQAIVSAVMSVACSGVPGISMTLSGEPRETY